MNLTNNERNGSAYVNGRFTNAENPLSHSTEKNRAMLGVTEYFANHSRSPKVIKSGTMRKLEYGFIFAFHSNHDPILYRFRDKDRYWSKIASFS